jgi:hypothetical protein
MAADLGPERARELTKQAVTSIWRAELAELNSMEASFAESLTTYVSLFKFGDEELRELSDTYTSYTNAMNQSIAHSKELLEVERAFATEQQAIAAKTEKAAEAARKYADVLATMPWSTREAINAANGAFQGSFTGATGKLQGMSLYDGGGNGARSGFEVPALPEYGGEYGFWKFNTNPIKSSGALEKMGTLPFDPKEFAQMQADSALTEWAEENRKAFEAWGTSIDLLGGAFKSLGDSIGGTTGQLLSFIGGLVDAAQQMLPFIAQIMAETAAREANASAAATEAAAKSMSAYAGIPFAGIGLGLAAVAAVVGAIQSVPKFAEGGIVTSATLGVFGEAGPEAVMPLDRLEEFVTGRDVRVTGNIKASGKELVVVLDNYNRVRNG